MIRIAKSGSNSTVVWNPWIDKSIRMPDFGDEEYLQMVCVESGNVGTNKITLPAGGRVGAQGGTGQREAALLMSAKATWKVSAAVMASRVLGWRGK